MDDDNNFITLRGASCCGVDGGPASPYSSQTHTHKRAGAGPLKADAVISRFPNQNKMASRLSRLTWKCGRLKFKIGQNRGEWCACSCDHSSELIVQ